MKVRKKIQFFGDVQGVGFRYRAKYAAESCGVTGWVLNEWDGSVTMEVQGTDAEIRETIKMIEEGKYIDVRDMVCKNLPEEEYERGFHIRG